MSDDPGDSGKGDSGKEVVTSSQTITDPRQQGLNLPLPPALQSLVDLERQRIESFNKRTEVVRYAIETNDAADRRQYDYQMAKLNAETNAATRRHALLRWLTIGGGTVVTVFVGTLLVVSLWGTPGQSDIALTILKVLGTGLGGYGLINGAQALIRRLSN